MSPSASCRRASPCARPPDAGASRQNQPGDRFDGRALSTPAGPVRGGPTRKPGMVPVPSQGMGRRLGASPPMRKVASWSRSWRPTEYKAAARSMRPNASSPRTSPPTRLSLAPGSPPSRPLRAACGGGLRPVLTAAAPAAYEGQRSGRRNGSGRTKKRLPTPSARALQLHPPLPLTAKNPYKPGSGAGSRSALRASGMTRLGFVETMV